MAFRERIEQKNRGNVLFYYFFFIFIKVQVEKAYHYREKKMLDNMAKKRKNVFCSFFY